MFIATCANLSKAQSISYKVVEDDPYNTKPIQVHLSPFYADAWNVNTTMGWELWSTVDIKKRLTIFGGFRQAYLDINGRDHADQDLPKPSSGLGKSWRFEAMGILNLADKARKTSLKVVLSSSSSSSGGYTYTNTKYIMVPGTKRRVFGLRGGFYNQSTAIDFGDLEVKDANKVETIPFTAVKSDGKDTIHFGSYGDRKGGSPIYNGYSMVNIFTLAAGINLKSVTNLIINADDYGGRSNSTTNNFYLDFMVAPVIAIKDVVTVDKSKWDIESSSKSYTGWKLGWFWHSTKKTYMSFKTEVGKRPGFKGGTLGNFYIDINMGINIGFKAKKLQASE
jgi:hypothetical protein